MSARTTVKSIQDLMRQDVGVDGDAQRLSQLCWMFFLKIIDDQDQQLELMHDGYKSPIPPRLQWRSWAAAPEGDTGDTLMAFVNDDQRDPVVVKRDRGCQVVGHHELDAVGEECRRPFRYMARFTEQFL